MPNPVSISSAVASLSVNDRPTLELHDGKTPETSELKPYVVELQKLLRNRGFEIPQDGVFGVQTKEAVVAFQRGKGLNDDGVVGRKTWAALYVNDRPLLRLYDGFDHVTPHLRDAVRELQSVLRDKGYPVGNIDGRFGPFTESLVKQFQKASSLKDDGIVGSGTWAALFKVHLESPYYKDNPILKNIQLTPATPIVIRAGWPASRVRMGELYNRMGGLIRAIHSLTEIPVESALAVFYVESGGRVHVQNRAIIRFENHHFFRYWGKYNEAVYNRHFQHGGQAGIGGNSWQNHRFRETLNEPFKPFHGKQDLEYRVLALSQRLAGDPESGLMSCSIGGPQILISAYRNIGYESAMAMYNAFQAGEASHILGFFDFCRNVKAPEAGAMIRYLKEGKIRTFTQYYNGSGQVETYSKLINDALAEAKQLGIRA